MKKAKSKPTKARAHSVKIKQYNPASIETKWQKKWQKSKIYQSKEGGKKDKFYVLDMFPYPSGEGLHVGHPKGYIATDVISRYKRMNGHSVLHPMGFDAFGLPAENYALKTKTNPADSVKKNVARYKKQLEILGFDYDWSREVNTTDPKYYKWTQWIFLKLLEKGLAYESYEPINWCPSCKTGLANEDVEDGRCERCGTVVEKKPMRQWVLKITDYAERLLADLDLRDSNKTLIETGSTDGPCFMQMVEPGKIRLDLPFVERKAITAIVKHWSEDKYIGLVWKKVPWKTFITGGVEAGQSVEQAALTEINEETGYKNIKFVKNLGRVNSKFFHVPKNENRFAHFDVLYLELKDGEKEEISENEKSNHEVVWVNKDEVKSFITPEAQKYMWSMFVGESAKYISEAKPVLDWPESIKILQKNWIGKSEGSLITFKVKAKREEVKGEDEVEVFTTRPDTLFGVTYVVLAPEHKLVNEFLNIVENKSEVEEYIKKVKNISEIDRTDAKKEKTGVELKGIKVINPANNEEVPLWIADYVLPDYGTGAVMAVPAHDDRDWEFAKKYGLAIKNVIEPLIIRTDGTDAIKKDLPMVERRAVVCIIKHWEKDEYLLSLYKKNGWKGFIVGGIEDDESIENAGIREIKEETGFQKIKFIKNLGRIHSQFFHEVKNCNRFAHFEVAYFELEKDTHVEMSDEEKILHDIAWFKKDEIESTLNRDDIKQAWKFFNKSYFYDGIGLLNGSNKFNNKNSEEVKKEITQFVGGKWVTKYKLRDWVFSRQRYWGEPIPVIHCENCKLIRPESNGIVPVPIKDLPVTLPRVKSYEPTGTGESPLASIDKWVNVKCPVCKGKAKRETNTMPQWAGSSWYYLRYMDPKNSKVLVDNKKEKYWSPVDVYVGGAEHATRHLIYARFWHKFLYDIGVVSTTEPFIKLQHVGLIMGEDGRKMSKRFGNVVNPDEIVKNYGADSLRLYEMFMGPFDQEIAWSTASISGVRRFIEKIWKLNEKVVKKSSNVPNSIENSKTEKIIHKAIKKVTEDIQTMRFNTAISGLMIAVNEIEKCETLSKNQYEKILQLVAPFAPHFTEEIWTNLGNKKSVHISPWPKYDPTLIVDDEVTIMIQINGKVRGSFVAPANSDNQTLEKMAKENEDVKKWLEGKSIVKVIVVPKRLVNIVVS